MNWYDPERQDLSPKAFRPRPDDVTGLSVDRDKYRTIGEAAQGANAKGYYVAVLRVRDLRARGLDVASRPIEGNLGHAEMPALTYDDRKSDRSCEWQVELAHQLTLDVRGPFGIS